MSDGGLSFPDPPRHELDRKLSDLVQTANEVLATQGRLRTLLHATQTITAQLDLDSVLLRIVEAVRDLTGARYAALGVLDHHGGLEQFLHAGMEQADVDAIGHLPHGEGLLGALIRDPTPIRVADVTTDWRAAGFPEGHPPMLDFLGVPIRVRGVIYGNLYLSGHPRGAFGEEDEQLVRSLATTAGFAIENARLYREMRHRQEWAEASAEISAHLPDPEQDDLLALIADRVQSVAEAMSTLVVLVADDPEQLSVVDVRGADPGHVRGVTLPMAGSLAAEVIRSGVPRRWEEREARALGLPRLDPFGPVMALPLVAGGHALGALIVTRARDAPAFTDADLSAAGDFAGRASIALELVAVRGQADRMLLFEERGRIARDLHDRVIQQLFATGMQLHGVLGTLPPGRNADRVDAAITGLDESITQIRRIIFTLQAVDGGRGGAPGRQRLFELIEERSAALSIEPTVSVRGPVDAVLHGELAEDVLAVVGEGIANAVRHAAGTGIAVGVTADSRGVTVTVANDGTAPGRGRRSGLRNLEQRATRRGGRMTFDAAEGRTVLMWTVPLEQEPADAGRR
jgi:signal transduction histidine kinase